MKFKTSSGTEYILTDIKTNIKATGEACPSVGPQGIPVVVMYTGNLSRVGKPLRNLETGGYIETSVDEVHQVEFYQMPKVGTRFSYWHPVRAGCYSTPITKIEE